MASKVSIIMGALNCEDVISKSIDSVLRQTYSNWEFIICDDGSTDNTYKVMQKCADIDDRIKIIRNKQNMGLAASLNRCIEIATGEYIARQDADDESMPYRLEKQVEFLEDNQEYDFVGSNVIYFDIYGDWGKSNAVQVPQKEDLISGPPFCHPSVMFRANCLRRVNGYRVSKITYRSQDYDLWFRMYSNGYRGFNIIDFLYKYNLDRNSYAKRKFKYRIHEIIIRYNGYKSLNFPFWKYIYIFKPIIAGIIPKSIMMEYHNCKFKKQD